MRLPVLDPARPARGTFASGPRALSSVRVLRVSITDRCTLRCTYCMPPEGLPWLAGEKLLSVEEMPGARVDRHRARAVGNRLFAAAGGLIRSVAAAAGPSAE